MNFEEIDKQLDNKNFIIISTNNQSFIEREAYLLNFGYIKFNNNNSDLAFYAIILNETDTHNGVLDKDPNNPSRFFRLDVDTLYGFGIYLLDKTNNEQFMLVDSIKDAYLCSKSSTEFINKFSSIKEYLKDFEADDVDLCLSFGNNYEAMYLNKDKVAYLNSDDCFENKMFRVVPLEKKEAETYTKDHNLFGWKNQVKVREIFGRYSKNGKQYNTNRLCGVLLVADTVNDLVFEKRGRLYSDIDTVSIKEYFEAHGYNSFHFEIV